jgi:hypothetical protein
MQKPPRSADLLVNRLMSCPDGLDRLKNDPEKTLREVAHAATEELIPPVLKRGAGIFYIIVISLGFVAVAAVLGAIYLTEKSNCQCDFVHSRRYYSIGIGCDRCTRRNSCSVAKGEVSLIY